MYGGLRMAIGALALVSLAKPRLASGTLLTLAFVSGGLASARRLGFLMDGEWSCYTAGGLGFEIISCGLALVALGRGGWSPETSVS